MNPDLDLSVERIIRAPRATVWNAWTDPASLERWWLPAPTRCRVDRLEARPGGAFMTSSSDDGADFAPHINGCFLVIDELERIAFTNAIDSAWRPATPPVSMTAEITLSDHPDGTSYRVVVRHGDPTARSRHEDIGFKHGWSTITEQLARLVESGSMP